jgi:cytochrome-b5 reductase
MIARARPAVTAISALAAGGLAIGAASRFLSSSPVRFDDGSPERAFKGGPAFLSLPLESAEQVNHNTKRLRFKLPSPDAVSGLPVSCECDRSPSPPLLPHAHMNDGEGAKKETNSG